MKKIFIVLLFAAFFQSAIAQDAGNGRFFNCYLGIGKSGISGGESWEDPLSFVVGAGTKIYSFSSKAILKGGLEFSFQGAGYTESVVSGSVRLAYLNVPLIFAYSGKNKIYGEIGLQPGILLSAKDKYDGESYDYKDHVNSFELGLPIGVGYHLSDNFSLGIRFTYGLTNLSSSGDGSDHNYMVNGLLTYTINSSKK